MIYNIDKVKENLVETIKVLDRQIDLYTQARKSFLKSLKELNEPLTEKELNKELLEGAKK